MIPPDYPEPLGYREGGAPILPIKPGAIATCAFVSCCQCGAAIRSNGGPMQDAYCPGCFEGRKA